MLADSNAVAGRRCVSSTTPPCRAGGPASQAGVDAVPAGREVFMQVLWAGIGAYVASLRAGTRVRPAHFCPRWASKTALSICAANCVNARFVAVLPFEGRAAGVVGIARLDQQGPVDLARRWLRVGVDGVLPGRDVAVQAEHVEDQGPRCGCGGLGGCGRPPAAR